MGWNTLSVSSKVLSELGVRVGLAGLLSPGDFGVFALALTSIAILSTFCTLGLQPTLIQRVRDENTKLASQSAFWLMLIVSVSTFAVSILVADFIFGYIFSEVDIVSAFHIISITLLTLPWISIHTASLSRALKFNKISIAETYSHLVFAFLAAIFACMNFGFEGLCIAHVGAQFVRLALLMGGSKQRIRLQITLSEAKRLLKISRFFLMGTLVATLRSRADVIIIGSIIGVSETGTYALALALTDSVQMQIASIINKTMFPVYSRQREDELHRNKTYLKVSRYTTILLMPLFAIIFLFVEPIFALIFSEPWQGAVPIVQVLSVASMVYAVGGYPAEIINASGRPDLSYRISLVCFLLVSLPTLLLFTHSLGGLGAAYSVLVHYTVLRLCHLFLLWEYLGIHPLHVLKASGPGIIIFILIISLGLTL